MIVDFHTHIFPDDIAERTIKKLGKLIHENPYTDGTLNGLKKSMKESKIDYSVILPVVTREEQFETVNSYAAQITGRDGILSFGGIHPRTKEMKQGIDKIVELGLKGIKIHPDFQHTFIDEECMIDLVSYALSKDLFVTIHAGEDEGLKDPIHCTPVRAKAMLHEVRKRTRTSKVILAHTGGHLLWDDVEQYLVDEDVLFDISYSRNEIEKEQMERIIRKHGANRVLMGSDSPWDGQAEVVQYVKGLSLTEEEQNLILGENAKRLLNLCEK